MRVLLNPPADALGTRNAIISWNSAKHLARATGSLSIKWMPVGRSVWATADATYRVEGERFLILNHDRIYSLSRDGGEPQESFCPFFETSFVERAQRDLVRSDHELLDRNPADAPAAIEFREQLYSDPLVLSQLRRMWVALRCGAATQDWLDEQFHVLAQQVVTTRADVQRAIARVPARRASTREELHRRLQRGREFIHAHFDRTLCLDDMSRAACLSPHHFHRLFHGAFGQTPHAYVSGLRLERAAALLARTELPVTDICLAVGFESLGSFSVLFRRRTGLTPTAFRQSGSADLPR